MYRLGRNRLGSFLLTFWVFCREGMRCGLLSRCIRIVLEVVCSMILWWERGGRSDHVGVNSSSLRSVADFEHNGLLKRLDGDDVVSGVTCRPSLGHSYVVV